MASQLTVVRADDCLTQLVSVGRHQCELCPSPPARTHPDVGDRSVLRGVYLCVRLEQDILHSTEKPSIDFRKSYHAFRHTFTLSLQPKVFIKWNPASSKNVRNHEINHEKSESYLKIDTNKTMRERDRRIIIVSTAVRFG